LLRLDVANYIYEHRVFFAVHYYGSDALDRPFVSHFEINAHILVLLLGDHDAFPAFVCKFFADLLRALLDISAIVFIQSQDVDPHQFDAIEKLRHLWFIFFNQTSAQRDNARGQVHFNEFSSTRRRRERSEIDLAGKQVRRPQGGVHGK